MSSPKVLGVIPARGGSKGVPRKNIKPLGKHPLLAYTIASSLASRHLTTLVVSTEDQEIATVAKQYGCRVPFVRPDDLATDTALAVPTIQHAVDEMERTDQCTYDMVVMLQPSSPYTRPSDIDSALEVLFQGECDSVMSVADVGANHPKRMQLIEDGVLTEYDKEPVENMPKQKLPPIYIKSGDLYCVKRDVLMKDNTFRGKVCRPYVIPSERHCNIDALNDWILAEYYLDSVGSDIVELIERNFKK